MVKPGASLVITVDGEQQPAASLGSEREFSVRLPGVVFDGFAHRIEVRLAGQREELKNSPLHFQSDYLGYVHMEPFAGPLLTGWALDRSRPGTELEVEILLHGAEIGRVRANLFRQDVETATSFSGKCGFSYAIEGQEQLDRSSVIRARISGTQFDLRGSPVLYLDTSRFLKTLHRVNSAFRFLQERTAGSGLPSGPGLDLTAEERKTFADLILGSGNLAELMELSRWFQAAGGQHITAETHRHRFYTYLTESFAGSSAIQHPWAGNDRIDVIFRVRAEADPGRVRLAFRRLMEQPNDPPFTVICAGHPCRDVLGGETGGRVVQFLDDPRLDGFAAVVNAAAALHRERDIAVVDCETLVPRKWLDRLRTTIRNSPAAGIAAPFATQGEICCYPAPGEAVMTVTELDTICEQENPGQVADLPAVHGLCAYIRRPCLEEVGLFDEVMPGSRNSAMADFCLRAGVRGWRSILAADLLAGTRESEESGEAYVNVLDARYPYFADQLVNFRVDDAALPWRRKIDWKVFQSRKKPVYCFLTHRFGGGTERHVRDLCEALAKEGIECLVIFSLDGSRVLCAAPSMPSLVSLSYRLDTEFELLVEQLRQLDIRHFHIHSNIAIPQDLMGLPNRLGVSYDCTIHDYSWFCPRVNLVDESGMYCGEPEPAVCDECVRQSDAGLWREFQATHKNVSELRARSQVVLSGARKVFCPSRDTKFRISRQFELRNLEVRRNVENPGTQVELPALQRRDPAGVAIIGFVSRKKGMDVLRDCAEHALRAELPLRFVVVGFTENDSAFAGLSNVTITGRYREGEAGALIRKHQLRLGFFPSVWPETYSYTLSIAVNCGLYPVAFDLGAIAERLRDMKYGHLIPLETQPEDINAALIACGSMSFRPPPTAARPAMPNVMDHYYSTSTT